MPDRSDQDAADFNFFFLIRHAVRSRFNLDRGQIDHTSNIIEYKIRDLNYFKSNGNVIISPCMDRRTLQSDDP